jgi:hypothetical protein
MSRVKPNKVSLGKHVARAFLHNLLISVSLDHVVAISQILIWGTEASVLR